MMTLNKPKLIFIGAVALFLALNVVGTYNGLTYPYPGLNDFMSRWEGARSYWVDGLNPYGEAASLNIQERIFGRAAQEGEDPGYFAYPFYTVFLLLPVVFTSYAWASAIWLVALEVCLILLLVMLLDLFRWRPGTGLLVVMALWMLLSYYSSRGLILGQPGVMVAVLEIAAVWALYRGKDELAGAALAISTLKPQMGFLIVPFLMLWALRQQRWRFAGWFAGVFGVLLVLSFALQPSWLGDWLGQVGIYTSYTALGSPVWIVTQYYLGLGAAGEWAVNLLLYGLMLWAWYGVLIGRKPERFLWTVTLTLTITHLTATRTATPHYVLFALPMMFYFSLMAKRDRRKGGRMILLALALLFVLPWVHFLATVTGEFEHPTVYLPVPLGVLALLWFTRRWWWDESPPMPATEGTAVETMAQRQGT